MFEKIKEFFNKKIVVIVEVVLLILITIGLFIGGYTSEGLKSLIDYVGTFVIGVVAFYKFIKNFIKKE